VLNWYSYGARFYDPALARFQSIDPLAEDYSFQSPYVYALNNPVRYTDYMGMGPEDEVLDQALEQANIKQGYIVSTNNETYETTIVHTTAGQHPDKSSNYGDGNVNIQVTQTTYKIDAQGNLSSVDVNKTGIVATLEETRGELGSISNKVTGVETYSDGYEFATTKDNSEKLAGYAKDPIVSAVSSLVKSPNGGLLFAQDTRLPGLTFVDKAQSRAADAIKFATFASKSESLGIEDQVNWDSDGHTTLRISPSAASKAAQKLNRLSTKRLVSAPPQRMIEYKLNYP